MGLFRTGARTKSWYKNEIDRKMREIAQLKVWKATEREPVSKALRQRTIDEKRADIAKLRIEMKDAPKD